MSVKKNEHEAICLEVTEGLKVTVLPDSNHEFLMSTKEIAAGYGVTEYNIRRHKLEHSHELLEGKHFMSNVSIPHAAAPGTSRGTLWTKRGIVRLGFFIKSERAKLFRDWAEELIIKFNERPDLFGQVQKPLVRSLPKPRNHNRLTHLRLLGIMSDVCRIDDKDLRISLTEKLMKGAGV